MTSLWIVVTGPLKTMTLCVGVMLTVAAHCPLTFDCSCELTRRPQDLPGLMIRDFSSMILIMVNKQDYVNWDQSSDFHGYSIITLASQGQKSAEIRPI